MLDTETRPAPTLGPDGYVETRLSCEFGHPAESVWLMIAAPDRLPLWLAPGTLELRPGGRVRLDFGDSGVVIDSVVTAYHPGDLLEYSWSGPLQPERPLRWVLEPLHADRTRLELTLRVPCEEDAARASAGWEAHLDMLTAALEGVPIRFPFADFQAYREQYGALLGDQRAATGRRATTNPAPVRP